MTVELVGADEFSKFLVKFAKESKKDLDVILTKAAFRTQQIAVTNIQTSVATGIIYQKYKPRRTHQASAPGQFPKTDTGTLVRNILVEKDGALNYSVGSRKDAPHGLYLELKSPAAGGRPWLKPSVDTALLEFDRMAKTIL